MKTLTMTPSPNTIIAVLLDIVDAAYAVSETATSRMIGDGSGMREGIVDFDALDALHKRIGYLSTMPQPGPKDEITGPARARWYLESFLQGEHIVGEIAMTRTRPFGVEGVDHVTVHVGTADVQRDGIEFHTQPWNAPVAKPASVDPVVEANRELLLARSNIGIDKYGVTLAGAGLSKRELLNHALQESLDLANYLQAELQRSDAEQEDMRTNMLADTADEAHKIINDAGLLKNFVELFTMRDPGVTMLKVYEAAHCDNSMPWNISVYVENKVMRNYRSTSLHQAIVKAHKGEQDHEYPEPDAPIPPTWDMSASMPLSIMPAEAVVGISTAPAEPTVTDSPRRKEMVGLLCEVKDRFGADSAKSIFGCTRTRFLKMSDIPDDQIEIVIAACEHKLKEPK